MDSRFDPSHGWEGGMTEHTLTDLIFEALKLHYHETDRRAAEYLAGLVRYAIPARSERQSSKSAPKRRTRLSASRTMTLAARTRVEHLRRPTPSGHSSPPLFSPPSFRRMGNERDNREASTPLVWPLRWLRPRWRMCRMHRANRKFGRLHDQE
jgi:hypothetical protein